MVSVNAVVIFTDSTDGASQKCYFLFQDPANGDFTLPDDSPAYDIGFEPIDMSDIGPRKK